MAGKGMGAATKGMMKNGGVVNQHKRMAMGMMGGGMAKGYRKGGCA